MPQGQVVRLAGGSVSATRIWAPRDRIVRYKRPEEYGEHLRAEMDRAVAAQLRRHHGKIGSQLSAGRDSSAVTTTAALALKSRAEELFAYTAAPRIGAAGPPAGFIADESALARETAARHGNVRHFICRPDCRPRIDQLTELHRFHFGPLLNPTNLPWWADINARAMGDGASVLLFGSSGNFALSGGGTQQLRDMLTTDGVGPWLANAIGIGGLSPIRWRNILNVSFGPAVPLGIYQSLMKTTGRHAGKFEVAILRVEHRRNIEDRLNSEFADVRPPSSWREFRRGMLVDRDQPEKISLARWSLDARDPTADRRLIDFCFSLPNDQLVSGRSARPAFEAAFRDRIPARLLSSKVRGYQSADWYDHFQREDVRAAFQEYRRNHVVAELFDLAYIQGLIDNWPSSGWHRRQQVATYRNDLIGALSLANFIALHFPN